MTALPAPRTARPAPRLSTPIGGSVLRGILLMCLGVSMFPLLNGSVKALTVTYPVLEIVWARFTGHLLWVLIVFLPHHGWRLLIPRRPSVQIARSFLNG